jgi:uncharacterized SAM-binding protein YcdF (DUF218 family)
VSRVAHPLRVLLLAPVWLVVVVGQALWAMWTAPVVPAAGSEALDAWVAANCPADALIVMGAAQYDGTPSDALARRLDGAARLYEAGCAPVVVVSGGGRPGDRTTEGAAGVAWLADRGLPAASLRAETEARTTVENLRYAKDLAPAGRWWIVTDDLHTVRTQVAADRLGLDAGTVGVATRSGRAAYAWREVVALVAYRLGAFR